MLRCACVLTGVVPLHVRALAGVGVMKRDLFGAAQRFGLTEFTDALQELSNCHILPSALLSNVFDLCFDAMWKVEGPE